jgi:DNA-binding SARP family transcriptional activator
MPVSGVLRQTVLAILLARANEPVSVDVLLDALWGERPDPRGVQKLQLHVYKLRRMLDRPERLSHSSATRAWNGVVLGKARLFVDPGSEQCCGGVAAD